MRSRSMVLACARPRIASQTSASAAARCSIVQWRSAASRSCRSVNFEASAIRVYPIPVAHATSAANSWPRRVGLRALLAAGVAQLVHERDVAGDVDDQRGDPDPGQHRVRGGDQLACGRGHELCARASADDLLAVVEHVDAGLMAVLQGAHEAFLIALQLLEPLSAVERAVKDGGELDALGLPLLARHHPRGRVAVAVAARAVQPAGAQRVAGGEPERELVAGAHDPAVLVDDPRAVGRRQDLKRRVGQQLALAVDLDVADRVQQRLITRCGLEVQAGEHAWRELREMRMARGERVAALILDAPRQPARVLCGGAQPHFADLERWRATRGPRRARSRRRGSARASARAARDRRALVRSARAAWRQRSGRDARRSAPRRRIGR